MSKVSFIFSSTIFVLLLVGLVKGEGTDCSGTLNHTAQYLTDAQRYLCTLLEEPSFGGILNSGCDVVTVTQLRAVYESARALCATVGIIGVGQQTISTINVVNTGLLGGLLNGVLNLVNGVLG